MDLFEDEWHASLQLLYYIGVLRNKFIQAVDPTFLHDKPFTKCDDSHIWIDSKCKRVHNSIGSSLKEMSPLLESEVITSITISPMIDVLQMLNEHYQKEMNFFSCPLLIRLLKDAHQEEVGQTSTAPSYLSYLLRGEMENLIYCRECPRRNRWWELEWVLQLDVPTHDRRVKTKIASLLQLIKKFESDNWKGVYTCYNNECSKVETTYSCRKFLPATFSFIHLRKDHKKGIEDNNLSIEDNLEMASTEYILKGAILRQKTKNCMYSTLIQMEDNSWDHLANGKYFKGIEHEEARELLEKHSYLLLYCVKGKEIGNKRRRNNTPEELPTRAISPQVLQKALKRAEQSNQQQAVDASSGKYQVPLLQPPRLPTPPGFCGLVNLDYVCYMNAILQALYTSPRIKEYLIQHPDSGPYHGALSRVFLQMETSTSGAFKPQNFADFFRESNPKFNDKRNLSNDAHEFLNILLQKVIEESTTVALGGIKPPEQSKNAEESWNYHIQYIENSEFSRMFLGQLATLVKCDTCKQESETWSCILQLPVLVSQDKVLSRVSNADEKIALQHQMVTLVECIDSELSPEIVTDENAPNCTKCNSKQPATIRQTISRLPSDYLIIQLKRYTSEKIYIDHDLHFQVIPDLKRHFQLSSVILYFGTGFHGHYYTLYLGEDSEWVKLDDLSIVKGFDKKEAVKLINGHGYVLIYRAVPENVQKCR